MEYDVIIRHGTVVDGTGAAGRPADIGIRGDRIAAVGHLPAACAGREIDATGLIVAPGFIDPHTHVHNEAEGGIITIPDADNYVRQGVTTVIAGNCGGSPWPMAKHLKTVESLEFRQNYCTLVGMATIRGAAFRACGRDPAIPAVAGREEIAVMQDLVRQAMDEGARGISTGYFGAHVTTDEIVEVARVVGEQGGIYSSHIRNEGDGLLGAVEEIAEIGFRARIPVQISHIKTYGARNWWKAQATLEIMDRAHARGVDIMADRYPYTASYTGVGNLLPIWTRAEMRARGPGALEEAQFRATAIRGVEDRFDLIGGPGNVLLAPDPPDPEIEGSTLEEYARSVHRDPAEAALDLLERGSVSCIYFALSEENIDLHYRHPLVMTGSDGQLRRYGSGVSHPRNYGTFPRMIGRYARDRGGLTCEEAVRKCSGMAAGRWGLHHRGTIAEGNYADIVVFSWDDIADHATFTDQHRYPTGIPWVLVNGQIAVESGVTTGRGHGRVIEAGS